MPADQRDLLALLKFELEFIEKGGYGSSPRQRWHVPSALLDSPTCMNYDRRENPAPCSECALMKFVPPERQQEKTPCWHIALNSQGETLDGMIRSGTQAEVEEKLAGWLRTKIQEIEQDSPPAGEKVRCK
jgi:hypothetical protein